MFFLPLLWAGADGVLFVGALELSCSVERLIAALWACLFFFLFSLQHKDGDFFFLTHDVTIHK